MRLAARASIPMCATVACRSAEVIPDIVSESLPARRATDLPGRRVGGATDCGARRAPPCAATRRSAAVALARPQPISVWRMQAAACAAPAGSSGGTTSAQRAIAYGQRVRKTQPDGGASGDGSSPESALRAARASAASPRAASTRGVLASRARVYGWRGAANSCGLRRALHHAAEVHHDHLVGDQLDDREVVRDEDVGDAGRLPAGPSAG